MSKPRHHLLAYELLNSATFLEGIGGACPATLRDMRRVAKNLVKERYELREVHLLDKGFAWALAELQFVALMTDTSVQSYLVAPHFRRQLVVQDNVLLVVESDAMLHGHREAYFHDVYTENHLYLETYAGTTPLQAAIEALNTGLRVQLASVIEHEDDYDEDDYYYEEENQK